MWRWIMLCGVFSCAKDHTGLNENNLLKPCPPSPNCVCSTETEEKTHLIQSLKIQGDSKKSFKVAVNTIKKMGGDIVTETSVYCHATFTSNLLRFTDDFEILLRKEQGIIDIKSSSRVGYSDFGVNRKRTESMRQMWLKSIQNSL
ncbi:MAG: DUF1499 domain-containing protein [Oligoflexales bacterium]